MSKFVIKRDKQILQQGDISQLPDIVTRKQMRAAGLKIYIDGKVYRG